jgi:hypothetical protein
MKTLRLLWLAVMMALVACGDAVAPVQPPPPPAIVKLLVADPDTGFWLGESLSLSGLVTGAVTENGDTVPPPPLTWTIPAGFTRDGDRITATREARGALQVHGSGEAVIQLASTFDLSALSWAVAWRCYDAPNGRRDVEDPPIGVDSALIAATGDSLTYSTTDWADVHALKLWVQEVVTRFWKDGVVDTARNATAYSFVQDTTRLWFGPNKQADAVALKLVTTTPLVYRMAPPGICSSDWRGGGTEFTVTER